MADKRSFEEQVRDELAGFTVSPEAFVWENVERSLHKERKRRWIIWFFFIGITGSATSYWMYHQFKAPENIKIKQVMVSNIPPVSKNEEVNTVNPSNKKEENTNPAIEATVPKERTENKINYLKKISSAVLSGKEQKSTRQPVKASIAISKTTFRAAEKNIELLYETTGNIQPSPIATGIAEKDSIPPSVSDVTVKTGEQKTDPSATLTDSATIIPALQAEEKKTVTTKTRNPWKFYGVFDVGQSGVWHKSYYENYISGASFNPGIGVGGGAAVVFTQGESRSAFSFGAGIDAEKTLSRKWDVGVAVTYQQYASKISVGIKVNNVLGFQNSFNNSFATTANGYYIGALDETYINTYHLLETGISFYRKYKLGSSFSLRWQLGVAGAWLFNSNALHYDELQRIMYKDNTLLHRFQLNMSTGLEAGIGKAQRVFIGPQFTYFPTNNAEQTSRNEYRHLMRIGLRTHVLLIRNRQKKK